MWKAGVKTCLRDGIEGPAHVQDTLGVAGDAFGDHDTRAGFLADFVYVRAVPPYDDTGVRGDDKAAHVDVL